MCGAWLPPPSLSSPSFAALCLPPRSPSSILQHALFVSAWVPARLAKHAPLLLVHQHGSTAARREAWCPLKHAIASLSLSHGGYVGGEPGAPSCTRKRLTPSLACLTATREKGWCLLIHMEAPLSLSPGQAARGKAWCLLIHAEASPPPHHCNGPGHYPGASSYTRKRRCLTTLYFGLLDCQAARPHVVGREARVKKVEAWVTQSHIGGQAEAWCLLIHADASLSFSL